MCLFTSKVELPSNEGTYYMVKKEKKPVVKVSGDEHDFETDPDLKAKQLEWYDSMIEMHKADMKRSAMYSRATLVVMVLAGVAMVTIIISNIISCLGGK